MDRDEFMELVYETFADEPDNVLANGIIEAADAYVEHEKAQLSKEGTTSDLISRQAAIDALAEQMPTPYTPDGSHPADEQIFQVQEVYADCITTIKLLPPAKPERQRGEWIEISSINHTYKCSECGRLLVNITDGRNNVSKHYPYCHCGADMRGERQK